MTIVVPDLEARLAYSDASGCATWEGHEVEDEMRFREFLAGPVNDRVSDREMTEPWEEEIRGLASTDTDPNFLEDFFEATPETRDWELGEALAETVLDEDEDREVVWPWNDARDRKTPKASLPGADLVGFARDDDGYVLLLGEVKSSRDSSSPPGVMYGEKGMHWQLYRNATRLEIQHRLWKWLSARCESEELKAAYRQALQRYLHSNGTDLIIAGVLCRDIAPNVMDLKSRAESLGDELSPPTKVEFSAWYLPVPIAQWTEIAGGDS